MSQKQAVLGNFGELPYLIEENGYDFAITKGSEIFYVDFRKKTIIPKRGFLKPYLKYTMKKRIKDKTKQYSLMEEITFKDNPDEKGKVFKFEMIFLYRRKNFLIDHGDNSRSVFKITNHLLYHEYWYRSINSAGDYISYNYDTDHKYKVNIENYYTTYLPHEAYFKDNL